MTELLARPADRPEIAYPPPISLARAWPWMLFAAALLALLYFVCVDEGAAAIVPGTALHEWVHDGRHLLGFPCH